MAPTREPSAEQLTQYKNENAKQTKLTTSSGTPIGDKLNSMTAGPRGPLLVQDFVFMDEMAHFDRERIPERVVHAKGAGAHGYLEITHDITKYTKAAPFAQVGKKTPCFVRFSTVGGESGSADTARDPRGFAMKFYTEEGNWDLVGNNTPIFFLRDPMFFPNFIHTQKRNPVTHLKDSDMFWDYISLRQESCHQVMFLFSDRGTPDGYRHMNGYGSHTFKFVNASGNAVYCKFHFKTAQKIKNLSAACADKLAGKDPDYSIRDLYNSIAKKEFPVWDAFVQIMTFEQAEKEKFNPFDLTKVWSHKDYPLIPYGRMVLDRNPSNYFAEVEQVAFSPANFIPGIEASPDKVLQGRMFSYTDTHYHRLGTNYRQIPINCPLRATVANTQRDGPGCIDNQGGAPNYFPNSFSGLSHCPNAKEHRAPQTGDCHRYDTTDDDNFTQPGIFWSKTLNDAERTRLCENIAGNLSGAQQFIQERVVAMFTKVHADMGKQLKQALDIANKIKNSSDTTEM